ncbi:MAG: hypothetical protein L0I76_17480 [Pseudonocardia sp.]|nr:hypothetical protein [Pseudonocardia sp.]
MRGAAVGTLDVPNGHHYLDTEPAHEPPAARRAPAAPPPDSHIDESSLDRQVRPRREELADPPPVAAPSSVAQPSAAPRRLHRVTLDPGHHVETAAGESVWMPGSNDDHPADRDSTTETTETTEPTYRRRSSREHAATGTTEPQRGALTEHAPHPQAGALMRSVASLEGVTDAEASVFAARFAADYLSWSEDDPTRRAEVLRTYLADARGATLGWHAQGRQRADSPIPGRLDRRADTTVIVEVWVRVTAYHRATDAAPEPIAGSDTEPYGAAEPSCAPAPHAQGWTPGAPGWLCMAIPVTRDQAGRLVVDPNLIPDPHAATTA